MVTTCSYEKVNRIIKWIKLSEYLSISYKNTCLSQKIVSPPNFPKASVVPVQRYCKIWLNACTVPTCHSNSLQE